MAKYEIKDGVGIIPEGATEIDWKAFDGCKELTNVVIPNSVKCIKSWAIHSCTGLTRITIPDSVTEIDNLAFYGCTGLTSIIVSKGNKIFDSRNDCNAIIETKTNKLLLGCKNTVIPDSVKEIDFNAFNGCTRLTDIVIPDSVTEIECYAFQDCSGLTSIKIPGPSSAKRRLG